MSTNQNQMIFFLAWISRVNLYDAHYNDNSKWILQCVNRNSSFFPLLRLIGDEKISIKAENAAPQADEAMPDVPVERRLPPKKMKFLEERNGGAHSTGSPAEIKNESMKYVLFEEAQ